MPFELKEKTQAILNSVTPRREKHGDQDVPAVTLGLRITAANTMLELLAPGLTTMLYKPVEREPEQSELPEVEPVTNLPLLKVRIIDKIAFKGELNGWSLAIEYGIDESSAIHLSACKCDKFQVWPSEGGSIELGLRISTSDVDEESMGRLTMLLGGEITITLVAPERPAQPIDGSTAAFEADYPGAALQTDLLDADPVKSAADDGNDDDTSEGAEARGEGWPFPGGEEKPSTETANDAPSPKARGKRSKAAPE